MLISGPSSSSSLSDNHPQKLSLFPSVPSSRLSHLPSVPTPPPKLPSSRSPLTSAWDAKDQPTSLHHDNSICCVGSSSFVETSPLKPAPPPSAQPCPLSSWRTLCHTTVPCGTPSSPEPFSLPSTLSLGQHLHASGLNTAHEVSPPDHTFGQAPREHVQPAVTSRADVTHAPQTPGAEACVSPRSCSSHFLPAQRTAPSQR